MSLGRPGSAPAARVHPHSRLLVAISRVVPLLRAGERGGRARGVGAEGVAGGSGRQAGAGGEASGHRLSLEPAWQRLGVSLRALVPAGGLAGWLSPSGRELCAQRADPPFYRAGLWLWEFPFFKWPLRQRDTNPTHCTSTGDQLSVEILTQHNAHWHCELSWLRR